MAGWFPDSVNSGSLEGGGHLVGGGGKIMRPVPVCGKIIQLVFTEFLGAKGKSEALRA